MVGFPEEFLSSLPKRGEKGKPLYWLWVFDPQEDRIHLEDNADRHPADHVTHKDLAAKVLHPDRIHGYAYAIAGGYRITDFEHRPVDDPHVRKLVRQALNSSHRPATL